MNRRGFMAMVGAAICLPAIGKTAIPEATMRMAKSIAVRNVIASGTVVTTIGAGVRRITDIHWTEVSLNRKGNVDPTIKPAAWTPGEMKVKSGEIVEYDGKRWRRKA